MSTQFRNLQIRIFVLSWLGYFSYYITRKNFSVAKTSIEDELGVSSAALGQFDTFYLFAYAMGQFVCGALADRLGPRRILTIGMFGSASAALVFGMSSSYFFFALSFAVNGIFQSTGWSSSVKAMTPWFSSKTRGKIMGFWCTNYSVGSLVATGLATWLVAHFGWRYGFYVPGIWVMTIATLIGLFLVNRPEDKGVSPDFDEPVESLETPAGGGSFMRAAREPLVWLLGLVFAGLKLVRYSMFFWLPYFLERTYSYSQESSGYISLAFDAGGIGGMIVIGWLTDKFGANNRYKVLFYFMLALVGALGLYSVFASVNMMVNIGLLVAIGFLLFGPDAIISGCAAQDIGGRDAAASCAGIINGVGSVGGIFAGMVPPLISEMYGFNALLYFFIGLVLLGSALILVAYRMRNLEIERARVARENQV